jgi:radical SAM protein with 4Fe4S-binding SPASM domain
MNSASPRFARLNDAGREIAALFDGKQSLLQIAGILSGGYGVPEGEILPDVLEFYRGIQESGLLNESGGSWALEEVPAGLYLEITRRCNRNCLYCCAPDGDGGTDPLSAAHVRKILDSFARAGGTFAIISGGEPLVREDALEILEYACSLFPVSLVTNGTLIGSETARRLSRLPGLSVRVSLDGHQPGLHDPWRGQGSHREALRGITALLDAGMGKQLSLCMTISPLNVNAVPEMARFATGLGITSLVITPAARTGRAGEVWDGLGLTREQTVSFYLGLRELEMEAGDGLSISGSMAGALEKAIRRHSPLVKCPVGRRLAVDYRGLAYPCSLLMEEPFVLGNALKEEMAEILSGPKCREIARTALERKDRVKECASCFWKGYCHAGCMARAFHHRGTLDAPDPDCSALFDTLDALASKM